MEQNPKPNLEYYKKLKNIQQKMDQVKADLSPNVIKYMMRRKSADEIQTPLHDVDYNHQPKKKKVFFFKTFQKVTIDPHLKLDEINEEKWTIMANNYKSLIEKSRLRIGGVPPKRQPAKHQFLTRRQSIEFRLREIASAPSNNSSSVSPLKNTMITQPVDQTYDRFKKYYKKIGITNSEPIKLKLQKLFSTPNQPQMKKSQHNSNNSVSPTNATKVLHIKAGNHVQYLKEISLICNKASSYQNETRKDEKNEIQHTSQKVGSIQAQLNKYHQMLTTDLEKLEYLK